MERGPSPPIAKWSRELPLTVHCLTPLHRFQSDLRHVSSANRWIVTNKPIFGRRSDSKQNSERLLRRERGVPCLQWEGALHMARGIRRCLVSGYDASLPSVSSQV